MKKEGEMNITKKMAILISIVSICTMNTVNGQYDLQKHYVGPSFGITFLGSTVQFGANYEYSMKLEEVGKIGIGGIFRYWSYSEFRWSYTDIIVGAQANYHFKTKGKLDPWAGLVLAFDFGSWDYDGPKSNYWSDPSYGGLWMAFQGGTRYWISPSLALVARFSYGSLSYGALDLGVDFKLN